MKTTELNAKAFAYILSVIDGDNYGQELNTDKEKVDFVYQCFKSEAGYNIPRVGEYAAFQEWIMGLPSSFNVEFRNYRIIEIAKEWGSIPADATERQEDKILGNWFNLITNKFFQLRKRLEKRDTLTA